MAADSSNAILVLKAETRTQVVSAAAGMPRLHLPAGAGCPRPTFFSSVASCAGMPNSVLPCSLPRKQSEHSIPERYYPYDRLFASEFLRDIIPVHCLGDLRFLELVFPPYEPYGWPGSERATVLDWRDMVDWIRGKVNAPALTLRVVMADLHGGSGVRKYLTKDQGVQVIKEGYSTILQFLIPLAREDGLSGIYVQAAYPWRWTQATTSMLKLHADYGHGWVAGAEEHMKKGAEEFVRGKDSSLDLREIKAEPAKNIWQRWYEVG